MSSVTRYEPEEVIHRDRYETATMYEKADGGYVEFDDYEALRRERDAMAIYRDQGWAQAEKLESENERLRKQVEALQAAPNSWQSGYDKGRRDGDRFSREERDALRKDAERYRWLRSLNDQNPCAVDFDDDGGRVLCGDELDAAIDAALEARR